ncbi:MAG: hypothetical protein ACW981_11110 [Candidatus Hodarchaeales archaeon]|jgi:hypothetical protein
MLPNDDSNDSGFHGSAEIDQPNHPQKTESYQYRSEPNLSISSQKLFNTPDKNDLESEILSLYSATIPNFAYSFSGLKRKLGNVHQQSLTNSLDRLIEDSYLIKDQHGNYSLDPDHTPRGIRKSDLFGIKDNYWDERWYGRPLQHIPVKKVYQDLHGKWFGKSRFVGGVYNSQKNEGLLEWVNTTNDGQTQLNIKFNEVYARFRNLDWMERDKALEVFNRTFSNQKVMTIFEHSQTYNN